MNRKVIELIMGSGLKVGDRFRAKDIKTGFQNNYPEVEDVNHTVQGALTFLSEKGDIQKVNKELDGLYVVLTPTNTW